MLEKNRFSLCVTGHRPNQMFGYDIHSSKYDKIRENLERVIVSKSQEAYDKYGVDTFRYISGMALGVDTIFFETALYLREHSGEFTVQVIAAVPFLGQERQWPRESRKEYHELLKQADETIVVSKGGYEAWKMQRRNEFMVDHSDVVVAVYNGAKFGGTKNCVDYAIKRNKDIIVINPMNNSIDWGKNNESF